MIVVDDDDGDDDDGAGHAGRDSDGCVDDDRGLRADEAAAAAALWVVLSSCLPGQDQ